MKMKPAEAELFHADR